MYMLELKEKQGDHEYSLYIYKNQCILNTFIYKIYISYICVNIYFFLNHRLIIKYFAVAQCLGGQIMSKIKDFTNISPFVSNQNLHASNQSMV